VYDNFPCVRVGDYNLPSSMDLRQYLDEMQEVGEWEDEPPADLPTIPDDEVSPASWIYLKHLLKVRTRFYCPQAFLSLDFQCRDDVSELKQTFWD